MRSIVVAVSALVAFPCLVHSKDPGQPPGSPASAETKVLEAGARALQTKAPLRPMNVYLVGLHAMKDHPEHQMEAHHYCNQVNEDFAQCVIFDGNDTTARMTGVEYIVSEPLFNELPDHEKKFWHPHNFEILSGQLSAPGLPAVAETALMRKKMNSYGKTWHFWSTGNMTGVEPQKMPLGEAMLAWSFNREGEASSALLDKMAEANELDIAERRRRRQELVDLAKPQAGVDALKNVFGSGTKPIPGVVDAGSGESRPDR